MMCHRIGRPPISTIGLGLTSVSSTSRVPSPPAKITTFIDCHPRLLPEGRPRSRGRTLSSISIMVARHPEKDLRTRLVPSPRPGYPPRERQPHLAQRSELRPDPWY